MKEGDNVLNKHKLIAAMDQRMKYLQDRISRDFAGGLSADLEALREVKYWKEAIERGEFNIKIW